MEKYRLYLIAGVAVVFAYFFLFRRSSPAPVSAPTVLAQSGADTGLTEREKAGAASDLFKAALGYDLSLKTLASQERVAVASALSATTQSQSAADKELAYLQLQAQIQKAQLDAQTQARLAELAAQQKLVNSQNKGNTLSGIINAAGNIFGGIFGGSGGFATPPFR